MWRWDQQEPFAVNVPDENPSGLGVFDLPLRLPGQYFDKETNLHYNYFRDYDPSLGIYKQSDPIGLEGGVNTYTYVESNPLSYSDLLALLKKVLRHDFQLWQGSINLGSLKGKTRRKGHWQIYAMVPECFVELDEHVRKYDVNLGAKPSPSIGGKNPMVTTFWQWVVHTEYIYGPPANEPCCNGSQSFGGYTYDDGSGWPNFLQNMIDFLQGIDSDPKPGLK